MSGRWIVEREKWRPRLRRWDVRYFQERAALGPGWYRSPRYASKFTEDQARAVAAGQLRNARVVPLTAVVRSAVQGVRMFRVAHRSFKA